MHLRVKMYVLACNKQNFVRELCRLIGSLLFLRFHKVFLTSFLHIWGKMDYLEYLKHVGDYIKWRFACGIAAKYVYFIVHTSIDCTENQLSCSPWLPRRIESTVPFADPQLQAAGVSSKLKLKRMTHPQLQSWIDNRFNLPFQFSLNTYFPLYFGTTSAASWTWILVRRVLHRRDPMIICWNFCSSVTVMLEKEKLWEGWMTAIQGQHIVGILQQVSP